MSLKSRAAFLDRDGTIIVDKNYLSDPAGVELLPGAPEALKQLQAAGYTLVVVTNQSGVGRGMYDDAAVEAVNARMRQLLSERGVAIAGVFYCPHTPDDHCACRKPKPGLLFEAAGRLNLDIAQSVMIGDKERDVQAGMAAGCRLNILLDPTRTTRNDRYLTARDLPEAVGVICP